MKPQKISPEIWKSLSKSQKRAARKKMASDHLKSAVNAAVRRDNDFIARITGSLTGKSKGSVPMSYKLSKEEKAAYLTLSKVEQAVGKNQAFNAAESLTAYLEKSRFEDSVRVVGRASVKVLDPKTGKLVEQIESKRVRAAALNEIQQNFEDVKKLFAADTVFDTLNAKLLAVTHDLQNIQLQHDEIVKSGDKKQIATAGKALQECKENFAAAEKALNDFLNTAAIRL
jgi:hypothetical protein